MLLEDDKDDEDAVENKNYENVDGLQLIFIRHLALF